MCWSYTRFMPQRPSCDIGALGRVTLWPCPIASWPGHPGAPETIGEGARRDRARAVTQGCASNFAGPQAPHRRSTSSPSAPWGDRAVLVEIERCIGSLEHCIRGVMVLFKGPRELPRCVEDLVRLATPQTNPRELQVIVQEILDAFDDASKNTRDAAIKSIGRALGKAEGRGAQVLCLTLGALVEVGASPELAWPSVARDLGDLIDRATAFAIAAIKQAKDDHVETAIEAIGSEVAKKKPREAAAWNALPSRCLAAVACLTRSKKLRAKARKDDKLLASSWLMSDVVSEVGVFLQALRILDDATLLVLAPAIGAGWRFAIDSMPSNIDLHVLLADALIGDPKKGKLPGKRIDPKAIAVVQNGTSPKKPPVVTFPFHLVSWTAVESDGSLPPANPRMREHWIWLEDLPADMPMFGNERLVLLQEPAQDRPVAVEPTFEAVRPELRMVEALSPGAVVRIMITLAQAAAKVRSEKPDPSKKRRPRATNAKKANAKKANAKKANAKKANAKTR